MSECYIVLKHPGVVDKSMTDTEKKISDKYVKEQAKQKQGRTCEVKQCGGPWNQQQVRYDIFLSKKNAWQTEWWRVAWDAAVKGGALRRCWSLTDWHSVAQGWICFCYAPRWHRLFSTPPPPLYLYLYLLSFSPSRPRCGRRDQSLKSLKSQWRR